MPESGRENPERKLVLLPFVPRPRIGVAADKDAATV